MKKTKIKLGHIQVRVTMALLLLTLFASCSNEDVSENIVNGVTQKESVYADKQAESEIIPAEKDTILWDKFLKMQSRAISTTSYDDDDDERDEFFDENIYQLREIPLKIQARGTGKNSGKYLSCAGAGKEVFLASFGYSDNQLFYLKIYPPSTGIQYVIYSKKSNTPIGVGCYTNNPDKKILYAQNDDKGSLFMASWNLNPCEYQGYFAITNNGYLGQEDPNNAWSVFHYSIEAQDNGKIGYAKYSRKAQQQFLIQSKDSFTVDYIDFDKSSAKITKRTPLEVVSYGKNETEERRSFTITSAHYATDTSRFNEKSLLKMLSEKKKLFYCPKVEAEHIVVPSPINPDELTQTNFERNIKYSSDTQNIRRILKFDINGIAKPNSLIEVTSWLENYNVSVNYIAYMSYKYKGEVRKFKIKGTWYGTLYTTKRAKPDVVKFFDLDDGEELGVVKAKNIVISKTILK